jgi:hypothetical protein
LLKFYIHRKGGDENFDSFRMSNYVFVGEVCLELESRMICFCKGKSVMSDLIDEVILYFCLHYVNLQITINKYFSILMYWFVTMI